MTAKTWFGGSGTFDTAADWSPAGVPAAGDSALLGTGTLTVNHENLSNIPLTMGSYYGATLALDGAIVGNVDLQTAPTPTGQIAGHHTIDVSNYAFFDGTISTNLVGSEFSDVTTINIAARSVLFNLKDIDLTPQEGVSLAVTGAPCALLVNDGLVKAESGPDASLTIGANIVGFGTVELGVAAAMGFATPSGTAEFGGFVGNGQTFEFGGVGTATSDLLLQIDIADEFHGTLANFANTDTIELKNTSVTSDQFNNGVLTLSDGPQAVARMHFSGSYTTSDFITQVVGADTLIKLT